MDTSIRLTADPIDEVLKIAASTCLEILGKFAIGVIECFGQEYLRPPTSDELEKIYKKVRLMIFRNVGKYRLYTLGMEELSKRLGRHVHAW